MAQHAEDVTVSIGSDTLGFAQSMDWNQSGNTVEVTALGEVWKDYEVADLEGSCSISQIWTPTDTAFIALQAAFAAKSAVTVAWVDGDSVGRSASACITAINHSVSLGESVMTELELTFKGAVTELSAS